MVGWWIGGLGMEQGGGHCVMAHSRPTNCGNDKGKTTPTTNCANDKGKTNTKTHQRHGERVQPTKGGSAPWERFRSRVRVAVMTKWCQPVESEAAKNRRSADRCSVWRSLTTNPVFGLKPTKTPGFSPPRIAIDCVVNDNDNDNGIRGVNAGGKTKIKGKRGGGCGN